MIKPSTNLLNLLLAGCNVQLPNGVRLVAEDKLSRVRLIHNKVEYGSEKLDAKGVASAIEAAETIYANSKGDDFSDLTNPDGKNKYNYIGGIGIFTKLACGAADTIDFPKRKHLMPYNILNEDGLWLDGADSRVEIRRKFQKRLDRV